MRRLAFLASATLAGLVGAGAAAAGTLASATWTQTVDALPTFQRTTAQLGASGASTATSVSVNLSFPQLTLSSFFPKTSMGVLDLHRKLTQGGPQAITATPAMGGGSPGIPGTVVVRTAMHNAGSQFVVGVNTLLRVPLDIGHAGQRVGTFMILGQTVTYTADYFAWTAGTRVFSNLTSKGESSPPVTVMGSFALTGQGGGTVTLVSPTKFKAVCALLTTNRIESLSTLKLTFVPEPGTLLLIAAGAVALAWGRRG